jgi:hypothetical protein
MTSSSALLCSLSMGTTTRSWQRRKQQENSITPMGKKAAFRKAKKQSPPQQQQQTTASAAPELSTFSLAAAIEEARTSVQSTASTEEIPEPSSSSQPRKIFNIPSPLRKKQTSQSHQSLATSSSYNTAHESAQNTPAVSYFVDSSDEDIDPIIKNREAAISPTNSEIFTTNPEVTMATKKSTMKTAAPIAKPVVAAKPAPTPATTKSDEPHLDVAQHIYSHIKDIWAWGKTVPVVEVLLGITESVATKLLEATFKTDLPAIDNKVAQPNLKKLDDQVVTPAILAIWGIIGPAVTKGDEMIVKPVMKEVVPKVLETVGMGEKKTSVDNSPNPEYTSAPMVN